MALASYNLEGNNESGSEVNEQSLEIDTHLLEENDISYLSQIVQKSFNREARKAAMMLNKQPKTKHQLQTYCENIFLVAKSSLAANLNLVEDDLLKSILDKATTMWSLNFPKNQRDFHIELIQAYIDRALLLGKSESSNSEKDPDYIPQEIQVMTNQEQTRILRVIDLIGVEIDEDILDRIQNINALDNNKQKETYEFIFKVYKRYAQLGREISGMDYDILSKISSNSGENYAFDIMSYSNL